MCPDKADALATRRIRLGTAITPLARRRPAKLAGEMVTLDRETGGRMVLGALLGAHKESGSRYHPREVLDGPLQRRYGHDGPR